MTYLMNTRLSLLVLLIVAAFAMTAGAQTAPPVLNPIGPQSINEGLTLTVADTATDVDATTPIMQTGPLPANASWVDHGDGTGTLTFTPDFTQAGIVNVIFIALDPVTSDADSETVAITVNNVNQDPILAAIGAQNVNENVALNFGVSASDPDATTPTLTTSALPTGAGFTDNGNGTGTFNWTPDFTQAGGYSVTFYATDGTATDSEVVAITVNNVNQDPVLAAIGAKSVNENVNLNFGVSASDPDATTPTLTTSALPTGAGFTDNGNGTGTFNWTPTFAQAGPYSVTFYASDGTATDSEVVAITVNNVNQDPILAAIGAQNVNENVALNFGVTASDPDATTPTLTTSALPTGAGFTDNGNGTGTFNWTPTFAQAGGFSVTFYATDGTATDSEVVAITVNNVNQDPILAAIGAKGGAEGALLTFGITASDADGTTPTLTTSALPTGAGFVDNGNGTGTFNWTPDFTQAGGYSVTFYATDGTATDSEVVAITISGSNQAPVLAAIGAQSVNENVNLNFGVSAADADATTPSLTTSALPTGAGFTDNGNGTGTFNWTPTFAQAGPYSVTFYASDGTATDSEVVAITVNNVNQDPVLAAIGAKNGAEGSLLTFVTSASDPDGTTPSFTSSTLPTGATYIDNANGTATFSWTPDFTQAGGYSVTFRGTDGVATDSEVVSITISGTNQAPVLAAIGAKSVNENANLNFGVSASDPDATTPTLTTSALPTGAGFTDNANGTGTFNWTPTLAQAGPYNVTFYATDGTVTDSEVVAITVNNVNQDPVLAAIGAKNVNENVNLNFGVSASDPDATTPTLTTSALPSGASFVDNANGTGTFNWTPTFAQSGPYSVTFYASDGTATDSEVVAITVNNVNQDPILAAIGAKGGVEGALLTFGITASDADGTTPTLTTSALPTGAGFVDNANGTGTFTWTPDFTQAGGYSVTFYATDGTATDSEVVAITISTTNLAPILAAIGAKSVNENVNLNFGVSASDADATTPTLTTSALPSGASFIDNANGTGTFNWTPTFAQAGGYSVTFYASDGIATDSEVVAITVNNVNQDPILAAIGAQNINENVNLNFNVTAADADGTTPSFTTSTLPSGATFIDNGNGTGTFNWTPTFAQAGSFNVTFRATDGTATDSEVVAITVNNVNQDPVLAAIGAKGGLEGALLTFGVTAADADGTTPSFTTSTLPTGAAFLDNGNGTGTFSWTPDFTQSGVYPVTFRATDGVATDSEVVTITIAGTNLDPVLAAIGAKNVNENVNLNFGVSASDPDATTPTLTTSALPSGASFVDNANGTGTFNWTPTFAQSGSFNVTFYASDGIATDSEIVAITVNNVNQDPILAAIGAKGGVEGALLTFGITASDADGTTPTLTTSALPTGAGFVDNANGTGTFTWTPDFTQAGGYSVTFYATDGTATDSEVVAITISTTNLAPILAAIGAKSVNENVNLNFGVSASDADATTPTLTTSALPSGASFIDNANGTGTFNWTPTFAQAGGYSVTFYASDGIATDSEVVAITVNNVNQDPILAAIGAQSISENTNLNFGVSANDPDGNSPVLTTSALPTGATFIDNANGTGTFNWTPGFTQAGGYSVTFYASDGTVTDSEVVAITVSNTNQLPVLAAIGGKAINEGVNLAFTITAADADGVIPTLTSTAVPTGATFIDNGDGTGTFNWTPDFTQSGGYSVTFYASDGVATDSEVVAISVLDAGNQAPILAAIGNQTVSENVALNFAVSAADPELTPLTLTTSTLPANAGFVDNGDGTGSFAFNPDFTQAGVYTVTFIATDAGLAADSETITITVTDLNRNPVLAAIGAQSTTENTLLTFSTSASDPDGTTPTLTTSTLPAGAVYTDNGNGTGSFSWTPNFTQAGFHTVRFYASDGITADSEDVVITVLEAGNQPPVFATRADTSIAEGAVLSFSVSATDPDGGIPSLTIENSPTNVAFVDNGNGTGTFTFSPDFTQAGLYPIRFIATDASLGADSIVVNVTVLNTNRLPVLFPIGPYTTTEGAALSFDITAADQDGVMPVLSTSTRPSGANFADHLNGTGTLSWTPGFTQAGVYNVTFYATDGQYPADIDSEIVVITVAEAGNQRPVLALIGNRAGVEGGLLTFNVTAADPDGTLPTFSASPLPTNATFTNNGNGTATFVFSPDFNQEGSFLLTFVATDGVLADSELVQITIFPSGNVPPIFTVVADTLVNEGDSLILNVSASDPDAPTVAPRLSVSTTLLHYTFVDHNDGTGTLTYKPGYFDAGIDTVRFFAIDYGTPIQTGVEIVQVTTNDVNRPPTFAAAGPFGVKVNDPLVFTLTAYDSTDAVAGNRIFLSAVNMPTGATFTDNGDNTGTFRFTPTAGQAGTNVVNFLAVDQGVPSKSTLIAINVVVKTVNLPPVLAAIGTKAVTEGQSLVVNVSGSDPDDGAPVLRTGALPANATFVDNLNGTAVFTFNPSFTQAGLYAVTFEAYDGFAVDKEVVFIQVIEAGNQTPVFDSIPASPAITEGQTGLFRIKVHDPDGGTVTMSLLEIVPAALITFADSGNGLGTFYMAPNYLQAGSYTITIRATDGTVADTIDIVLTIVEAGNQPPVLANITDKSVRELNALNFNISATDVDATNYPLLTANPLPAGATFTDNRNGTGTFSWAPTDTDSGFYQVFFKAEDFDVAGVADSQLVNISVLDTNRAPVIITYGARTMFEGDTLIYLVNAFDFDGTIPKIRARLDGVTDSLATNMSIADSGNGSALLRFIPSYSQGAVSPGTFYYVRFYAKDGADSSIVQDALAPVQIAVLDRNALPIVTVAGGEGTKTIAEGVTLSFVVSATDPDGGATLPTLSAQNMPVGATFVGTTNVKTFSFTPTFSQAGIYTVRFIAVDSKAARDTAIIQIDVTEAGNQAPVFSTVLADTTNCPANVITNVVARAADPDLQTLTMTATPIVTNAGFVDSLNGTGNYIFLPDNAQIGLVSQIRIIATDPGGLADTATTVIRVVAFLRGDIDNNSRYTMNDMAYLISYLFRQGPEPVTMVAADVDNDGSVNILDVTYLINFLYFNGPQPPR